MDIEQLKQTYQTPPTLFPTLANGEYRIAWRATVTTQKRAAGLMWPVVHKVVWLQGSPGTVNTLEGHVALYGGTAHIREGHIMLYDGTVHAREVKFHGMTDLFNILRANSDEETCDMHVTWGAQ